MTEITLLDLAAQRRRLCGEVEAAIARVLEHGRFIMGPEVGELESVLSSRVGTRHCVTAASGTDALLLPLLAWGIGPGDAVFVPAFTFAATAEVVSLLRATPVFVDVEQETYLLDIASLEAAVPVAVGASLRPAVVISVDLFGQPCDPGPIRDLATSHGMKVLVDAAQSFGAMFDGRHACAFGDAAATSFFPAKPLGCYGDGGAVFTDDDELASRLRSLRVHGQGRHKYENVAVGVNARLDTIQAAVLLAKLGVFDDELRRREEIASSYTTALEGVVTVPRLVAGATSAWAQYTITTTGRDELARGLAEAGIPTAIYYPKPLPAQAAYRSCPVAPDRAEVSTDLASSVLSLPLHPDLANEDVDRVVAAVRHLRCE